MIPYRVSKKEQIPTGCEEHYVVQADGSYVLDSQGAVSVEDLNKVRTALSNEREQHSATKKTFSFLDGKDVSEIQTMLAEYPVLKQSAGSQDPKHLEALVQARVAPLQTNLQQLAAERDSLAQKFGQLEASVTHNKIVSAITDIATKQGVQSTALADIALYAQNFEIVDGRVAARANVEGLPQGTSPEHWILACKESRPHWWPTSVGGGAGGGRSSGQTENPWITGNLTKQMQLLGSNPKLAEELQAVAKNSAK